MLRERFRKSLAIQAISSLLTVTMVYFGMPLPRAEATASPTEGVLAGSIVGRLLTTAFPSSGVVRDDSGALPFTQYDLVSSVAMSQAVVADLDSDDDGDIVLVARNGELRTQRNRGASFTATSASTSPAFRTDGGRIAVGDLDLDGDRDAVYIRSGTDPLVTNRVLFNRWAEQGAFRFDTAASLLPGAPLPKAIGVPLLLDWDRDGDLDLAIAGRTSSDWRFLQNLRRETGTLSFVDDTDTMLPYTLAGVADAVAGDLDGDGYPDIVATGDFGTIVIANNKGDTFSDESAVRKVDAAGTTITMADFDGDSRADLFIARAGALWLYANLGPGPLKNATSAIPVALAAPAGAVAADLSFDGHPDLFIASANSAEPHVLLTFRGNATDGTPTFTKRTAPASGKTPLPASLPGVYVDAQHLTGVLVVPAPDKNLARAFVTHAVDSDCDRLPDPFENASDMEPLDPNDAGVDKDGDDVPATLEYAYTRDPLRSISHTDGWRDDVSIQTSLDLDGDGVTQDEDNCPALFNPDQHDIDGDHIGDVCDEEFAPGARAPLTATVVEFRQPNGYQDTRYLASLDRLISERQSLAGSFRQRAEFRLFVGPNPALAPVYELDLVTVHRYVVGTRTAFALRDKLRAAERTPGTLVRGEPVNIGWLSPQSASFGPYPALAKLRSLRHPTLGHQVLTINNSRAASLIASGYTEDALFGYVPANQGQTTQPKTIFALKNPADDDRRYAPVAPLESGTGSFLSEGEQFSLFFEPTASLIPLYRLFHANNRIMILTIDAAERTSLISSGYRDEGVLGWVFPTEPASYPRPTAALQRLRLTSGRRFYTTDRDVVEALLAAGAVSEGTEGWVVRPKAAYAHACTPAAGSRPLAGGPVERMLDELHRIADPARRSAAAAFSLNLLCSMQRVASGLIAGPVEQRIAEQMTNAGAIVKGGVRDVAGHLAEISATTRAELLGPWTALDPGACSAAPNWEGVRVLLHVVGEEVPHLRDNFCNDEIVFPDGTSDGRAITVGAEVVLTSPGVEPDELDKAELAANARPVILGVEGEMVQARHEALAATVTTPIGDGMSPYGVVTDIPCSLEAPCNAELGLLCGFEVGRRSDRCVAYPVAQKGHDLILRGYNFWDVDDAKVVFTQLDDPMMNPSVKVSTIDRNEPSSDELACLPPDDAVATHNRAHVPVSVNEGHFYRLQIFNHNGHFYTQADAMVDVTPRTIHVCYAGVTDDDIVGLPSDTNFDCAQPVETCPLDGVACSATWGTPPRPLGECGHEATEPVVCGETPEWFGSLPMNERSGDGEFGTEYEAIVYVEATAPTYTITPTLTAVECLEETGADWAGSDEPYVALMGIAGTIPPDAADSAVSGATWSGSDYDTGDRIIFGTPRQFPALTGQAWDAQMTYLLLVGEDDDAFPGNVIGFAVLIIAGAVVALLCGGTVTAWLGAMGGAAVLAMVWDKLTGEWGADDKIGVATFYGKPLDFIERIASTHAPDFLTLDPPAYGALPHLDGFDDVGDASTPPRLLHPWVDYSVNEEPLAAECIPGSVYCTPPAMCLANACVMPDFYDPTAGVGFRERREFSNDGGHYAIDLLWEITPTSP